MLTARRKTGELFCLGIDYEKETLLELRNKEEFFCPICGESVTLKLGEQRIFHFAHKGGGTCRNFHEPETTEHLEGKSQLYQWLLRQEIPCILEFYVKEIGQRPDIMFNYQGKKFALEFQCSPLPEDVFIKRTTTYLQHDYIPLWILSNRHIPYKNRNIVTLSNFNYFFLRGSSADTFYIPSYCPESRMFHFTGSIIPFSIKNAFAEHSVYPLDRISLDHLMNPKQEISQLNHLTWISELEKYNLNWSLHSVSGKNHFLNELYSRKLNLFLLPPEVGLPVPHAFFFQTSPLKWQTYLFLDVIEGKQPGDFITVKEIKSQVNKRIKKKEIILRRLPQLGKINPFLPVREYFLLLMMNGIVVRKNPEVLQLQRRIIVPRTNREKEEAKQQFLKGLHYVSQNS